MLFCDAAWFLHVPSAEHLKVDLNALVTVVRDRAPNAQIYICEPTPLIPNVQLIRNMSSFIEHARELARTDPL